MTILQVVLIYLQNGKIKLYFSHALHLQGVFVQIHKQENFFQNKAPNPIR